MVIGRYIDQNKPVSNHPLNRDLESWWLSLRNNRGGSTLFDLTRRHDSTITGSVWGGGLIGGFPYLSFDGTDDYVQLTAAASGTFLDFGTSPFTVTARLSQTANDDGAIIAKDTAAGAGNGLYLYSGNAGGIYDYYYWNGSAVTTITETPYTLGKVYHIAVVRRGTGAGELELYRDGALVTTTTEARNMSNASAAYLGVFADTNFNSMKLYDVRVYLRAISASEVLALHTDALLGYPQTLRRWSPRRLGPPQAVSFPTAKLTTWPPMVLGRFGAGMTTPAVTGRFKAAWARRGVVIGGGVH